MTDRCLKMNFNTLIKGCGGSWNSLRPKSGRLAAGDVMCYGFAEKGYGCIHYEPFVFNSTHLADAILCGLYNASEEYPQYLLVQTGVPGDGCGLKSEGYVDVSGLRILTLCEQGRTGLAGACRKGIEPDAVYSAGDILNIPGCVPESIIPSVTGRDTIFGYELIDECGKAGVPPEFSLNRDNIRSTQFTEEIISGIMKADFDTVLFRSTELDGVLAVSTLVSRVPVYRFGDLVIFALNGADAPRLKSDFSGTSAYMHVFAH